MLRKALVRLRKEYNSNLRQALFVAGGCLFGFAVLGVLMDVFLPFVLGWSILRAAALVPLSCAMFSLFYFASLFLHDGRVEGNPNWVPYRARFSVSWRRRIAIILGAVIFVFIYGTTYSPGYTIVSSLYVAAIISLVAFIRPTREESARAQLDIPDSRDIKFDQRRREIQQERLARMEEKRSKKKNK